MKHETEVRALVVAAIQLAFYRHDLEWPACENDHGIPTDEEILDLAKDVFGALRGANTCTEEPAEEWLALERALTAADDGGEEKR